MHRVLRWVVVAALSATIVVDGPAVEAAASRSCVASWTLRRTSPSTVPNAVVTRPGGRTTRVDLPVDAWSPVGNNVAYVAAREPFGIELRVRKAYSTQGRAVFDFTKRTMSPHPGFWMQFSPNGKKIALVVNHSKNFVNHVELWVVTLATKKAVRISSATQNVAGGVAWSPDSSTLYFGVDRDADVASEDVDVYRARASGGAKPTRIIATAFYDAVTYPNGTVFVPPASITGISVSPDGKRLAFSGEDNSGRNTAAFDLWVANVDGSGLVQIANNEAGQTAHLWPAWSPDSRRLAVGLDGVRSDGGFSGFGVIDVASKRWVKRVAAGAAYGPPAWSPNGKQVAAAVLRSDSTPIADLHVLSLPTMKATRVRKGAGTPLPTSVAWVPCP